MALSGISSSGIGSNSGSEHSISALSGKGSHAHNINFNLKDDKVSGKEASQAIAQIPGIQMPNISELV